MEQPIDESEGSFTSLKKVGMVALGVVFTGVAIAGIACEVFSGIIDFRVAGAIQDERQKVAEEIAHLKEQTKLYAAESDRAHLQIALEHKYKVQLATPEFDTQSSKYGFVIAARDKNENPMQCWGDRYQNGNTLDIDKSAEQIKCDGTPAQFADQSSRYILVASNSSALR
jgi:hypothetical protein